HHGGGPALGDVRGAEPPGRRPRGHHPRGRPGTRQPDPRSPRPPQARTPGEVRLGDLCPPEARAEGQTSVSSRGRPPGTPGVGAPPPHPLRLATVLSTGTGRTTRRSR